MPREISGLRIARSFITPTDTEDSRVIDFQLGARQGISIQSVVGEIAPGNQWAASATVQSVQTGTHTLHLESGSLETVPDAEGEEEDTIDSEIFFRQRLAVIANDDAATEFRSSVSMIVTPNGIINFERPLLVARNITHRGISQISTLDLLCHVTIYYVFVEFSLAELGLILARRT